MQTDLMTRPSGHRSTVYTLNWDVVTEAEFREARESQILPMPHH